MIVTSVSVAFLLVERAVTALGLLTRCSSGSSSSSFRLAVYLVCVLFFVIVLSVAVFFFLLVESGHCYVLLYPRYCSYAIYFNAPHPKLRRQYVFL